MNVGIIGMGVMGRHHLRIYRELGADIIGISDINKERLNTVSDYDGKVFIDYRDLLNENLNAISITAPTILHSEIASAAIERKINVLIEKPIADTMENAEKIVDLSEKNNTVLMVGHVERFNPALQKLKEIIDNGSLGKIITLTSKRVGPFASRVTDVGIITDLATHDIDIVRYLTGKEPLEIIAKSSNMINKKGDCAIIMLDFGEIVATIEVNWFTPHKVRSLVATGVEGIAYADYIEQKIMLYNASWTMEPKIDRDEPLKLEIKHFLECVQLHKSPLVSGQDGLNTLNIALKAEEDAAFRNEPEK